MSGKYTTTTPKKTTPSVGGPVNDPLDVTESGLSTSDTEKLANMFPGSPHASGLTGKKIVVLANKILHPRVQPGVPGWSDDSVNLDFDNTDALDQTAHGSSEIPQYGYAAYPSSDADTLEPNTSIEPAQPDGFSPEDPTDNLLKPALEGKKIYQKIQIGTYLKSGVKIVRGDE